MPAIVRYMVHMEKISLDTCIMYSLSNTLNAVDVSSVLAASLNRQVTVDPCILDVNDPFTCKTEYGIAVAVVISQRFIVKPLLQSPP